MIISHKHKFIYYAPVRTASTSLWCLLRDNFEAEELGQGKAKRHDMFLPKEYESYFTFMTVRNPYTRYVSYYSFFSKHQMPIEEWHKVNFIPALVYAFLRPVPDGAVPLRVDATIRIEDLDRDFNRLPFVKEYMSVPHFNSRSAIIKELPPVVAAYIKNQFWFDFKLYGYDPEVNPYIKAIM